MKTRSFALVLVAVVVALCGGGEAGAQERQITSTPKHHNLDNNDNFSADGRFLCYDTRGFLGPGIENGQTIEMVEVATGAETLLYAPPASVTGEQAAPGVGAVSFSPVANQVAFIHGPLLDQLAQRGYYAKTNRNGAEVAADGSGRLTWLDYRDVETGRDTLAGAHRGGTHRHEYSRDGKRIGFTYDDALLTQYGRTIGYMEPHPRAPGGATHFFALLVSVVPAGTAKPGEIEVASGDAWVDSQGTMRAFIGKVRESDGVSYQESLFVVDIPATVDITTADAGAADRYPRPPAGVTLRRLTHDWAGGIVRGAPQGDRIAYYAKAADGTTQVFIIPADGSDRHADPAKRPVQATALPEGAGPGLRWHSSGRSIACLSDNAVSVTCVEPGERFGRSVFLTPGGGAARRAGLVWSYDGKTLAYSMPVPTRDPQGQLVRAYDGGDLNQIFVVDFPDADGDGVADAPSS